MTTDELYEMLPKNLWAYDGYDGGYWTGRRIFTLFIHYHNAYYKECVEIDAGNATTEVVPLAEGRVLFLEHGRTLNEALVRMYNTLNSYGISNERDEFILKGNDIIFPKGEYAPSKEFKDAIAKMSMSAEGLLLDENGIIIEN